jgi:GT2 family glycosyltransferase
MPRILRQKKSRSEIEKKIKEALAKKPTQTGGGSGRGGILAEDIDRNFSTKGKKVHRIVNQRGGLQRKESRPAKVVRKVKPAAITNLPKSTIHPTSEWFTTTEPVDVSIVVPLYRSNEVILRQIRSWDLEDDGLKKEIIYVDDTCPNHSYRVIEPEWLKRKGELKAPVGKIIKNTTNGGFACACNVGANHSNGKYVIFLNADCEVTTNWIKPMIDLMESDSEIGIVGNMQLKNGKIDSAGSQWSWKKSSFQHIGRHIYHGKEINQFRLEDAPVDLTKYPIEREMVTGCCIAMPKKLIVDLEGFDINYRIGYWEDSDLNMRVRAAGYKVYYQPKSKIYHSLGHAKVGGHGFKDHNRKLFRKRWIDTGRLDGLVALSRPGGSIHKTIKQNTKGKVVGCVIACNEEEFLEASVDSVSPIVDEWYFVIGGNEYAHRAGMCDARGYPSDNTLEIAKKLASKYGGKVIEPPGRLWLDKVEMRNAYAEHLKPGNWMFMVDGDEVYKKNQLWRVQELMEEYDVLIMQFWLFWNNMNTIGTRKWEQYPQERVVKWKQGYAYRGKNHLHVAANKSGHLAKSVAPTWSGKEKLFYHYSWVRPIDKIRQKLYYYKYQSGNNNDQYVDDIFLAWRDNPETVRGKTHPMGGGDWAEFPAIHPRSIQELINQGRFDF